jgi:flagellar motor switch protein FliN/FliY
VTTTLANPLFQRIGTAATGAVALLPAGEPLAASDPVDGVPADLSLPTAVVAPFQGASSGELALLVDADVVAALQAGPAGGGDVTAALRPALEAVAAGLQIAIGEPQTLAGPMAVRRLGALDQVVTVVLAGAAGPRAAVLLGAVAAPEPTPAAGTAAGRPPAGRLDLLRGVEMQATVELGRARLTLNDLLGLRDGAVIELDRAAGDAADLSVNGRLIARGEIVVVDENYALRITEIVSGEGA